MNYVRIVLVAFLLFSTNIHPMKRVFEGNSDSVTDTSGIGNTAPRYTLPQKSYPETNLLDEPTEGVMSRAQNPVLYQCDVCTNTFLTEYELSIHRSTHNEESGASLWPEEVSESLSTRCVECKQTFKNAKGLKIHMSKKHTASTILSSQDEYTGYQCTLCKMSFDSEKGCYTHIDRQHQLDSLQGAVANDYIEQHKIPVNAIRCPGCWGLYVSFSTINCHRETSSCGANSSDDVFAAFATRDCKEDIEPAGAQFIWYQCTECDRKMDTMQGATQHFHAKHEELLPPSIEVKSVALDQKDEQLTCDCGKVFDTCRKLNVHRANTGHQ